MIKKLLTISAIIFVSGCNQTVPVKQQFPNIPQVLMEKCPALSTIDKDQVVFSEFLTTVTENYTKYHSCAAVVEAWQIWYIEQKKISDEINK